MRAYLLAASAGVCLFLTGCPIPVSKMPLSDEANSKIDQRLIGDWEVDVRRVHEKLGNKDVPPTDRWRFEKSDKGEHELRCINLPNEENEGGALPFYTTHFAMHDYFSLASRVGDDREFYVICRYEFDDENNGKFYLMDEQFIIEQIDAGKIGGKIDSNGGDVQGVMLDVDTEELREFVRRHGDKVFDLEHPLACKRIKPSIAQE